MSRRRLEPDNGLERFRRLWEMHFAQVSGYVLRRTTSPDAAADCASETFSIAWNKLSEVPEGDEALFWLYAVARNVLANHRRTANRYQALTERLAREFEAMGPQPLGPLDTQSLEAAEIVESLLPEDREVLFLTSWEGLSPDQVALVLGCSAATARVRLHRARARLIMALGHGLQQTGAGRTSTPVGTEVPTKEVRS